MAKIDYFHPTREHLLNREDKRIKKTLQEEQEERISEFDEFLKRYDIGCNLPYDDEGQIYLSEDAIHKLAVKKDKNGILYLDRDSVKAILPKAVYQDIYNSSHIVPLLVAEVKKLRLLVKELRGE